jgi:methyl-accepting chemotaxis protein
MLIALVWGLTLAGTVWMAAQSAALRRQRAGLQRVRERCDSPEFQKATEGSFQERWAAAGGGQLPACRATERVRELSRLRAGGYDVVQALSRLDQQAAGQSLTLLRIIAAGVLLLGLAGALFAFLQAAPHLSFARSPAARMPITVAEFRWALTGVFGGLWLYSLSLLLMFLQQAFLGELGRFTLLDLGPLLVVSDQAAAAVLFADRLERSGRRLEAVVAVLPECLDRFTGGMRDSLTAFAPRLENAAHNLLQSVEAMRQAGAELRDGTARFNESYAGIATTYARLEQLAGQVAGSQAGQQERLSEIAAGLHGITESLTTVVASANESQEAVGRIAGAVTGAASGMQNSIGHFQASVDQLAAKLASGGSSVPSSEGVTLRRLAEQQQQFINVLDHRLSRRERPTAERR